MLTITREKVEEAFRLARHAEIAAKSEPAMKSMLNDIVRRLWSWKEILEEEYADDTLRSMVRGELKYVIDNDGKSEYEHLRRKSILVYMPPDTRCLGKVIRYDNQTQWRVSGVLLRRLTGIEADSSLDVVKSHIYQGVAKLRQREKERAGKANEFWKEIDPEPKPPAVVVNEDGEDEKT